MQHPSFPPVPSCARGRRVRLLLAAAGVLAVLLLSPAVLAQTGLTPKVCLDGHITYSNTCPLTNYPPEAAADAYVMFAGTTLEVPVPGVLANDYDPEGFLPNAVLFVDPAHGVITWTGDGAFLYRPAVGFQGTESFTYWPRDASGNLSDHDGTITITVLPPGVTIAGTFQSELGCSSDWQADCGVTHLALGVDDGVGQQTFAIPAGTWAYKAALGDSWDENYGRYATLNGGDIPLTLLSARDVTFYYDPLTHWVTDNASTRIVTAAGTFQTELGCPADWDPTCLRSWLQDIDEDGTFTFVTDAIRAGSYLVKAAVDEGWSENYGADGMANGAEIPFSVPNGGGVVTFTFVSATNVLSVAVDPAIPPSESLIISEYVEGSGTNLVGSENDKALELYNGTSALIDLAAGGYAVDMFFDGSTTSGLTIELTGTVAAGEVFVLAHGAAAAAILAAADQTNSAVWFDGNDAVILRRGTTVLDAIGQVGVDPGLEWGSGDTSTKDNVLRRNTETPTGDPNLIDAFYPSLLFTGHAADAFGDLGTFTTSPPTNTAPLANAGPDQTVIAGQTVVLDGNASSDPDGDALTYAWTLNGPGYTDTALEGVEPTFCAATDGAYTASLVVNDATEDSAPDAVAVTAITATAALDALLADVEVLRAAGVLNKGQANALSVKLRQAQQKLARGQSPSGPLGAFRSQVAGWSGGVLTEEQAAALIASVDAVTGAVGSPCSAADAVAEGGTSAAKGSEGGVPGAFALSPAYPNPFSVSATVAFEVAETTHVRLVVYDVLGREVAVLADGPFEASSHEVVFDAASLPSGVYLVRMTTAEGFSQTQRLTLMR